MPAVEHVGVPHVVMTEKGTAAAAAVNTSTIIVKCFGVYLTGLLSVTLGSWLEWVPRREPLEVTTAADVRGQTPTTMK